MKRLIALFIPIFTLTLTLYAVLTPVEAMSKDISGKVFRLHIIANSNSDADQALKLKVRDEILKYTKEFYADCESCEEAQSITAAHLKDIQTRAQQTVAFYGYEYDVHAYTAREYFNTRVYDGFALPAGYYESLKIVIGEGLGKNWWCVMYPAVCISGCTDDFDDTLTKEETQLVTERKYIVRFKIIEIVERIKEKGRF